MNNIRRRGRSSSKADEGFEVRSNIEANSVRPSRESIVIHLMSKMIVVIIIRERHEFEPRLKHEYLASFKIH